MIAVRRMVPLLLPMLLIPLSGWAQGGGDGFRSGYAEADITPPAGTSMPGYFTDRKATGTADPLMARVLWMGHADLPLVMVSLDLIAPPRSMVESIRAKTISLCNEAGLREPAAIWVHATHTHTGGQVERPFTSDAEEIYPNLRPGVVDQAWVRRAVDATAAAIVSAGKSTVAERDVTLHEGLEHRVAFYRRFVMRDGTVRTNAGRNNPLVVRPAGEVDPRVHTLRFPGSRTLMVIFGVHPDTVGGTRFSADYPHYLVTDLKRRLGADWNVIFFNAASGNINHIDVHEADQPKGAAMAKRIGLYLAETVEGSLSRGKSLNTARVAVASSTEPVTLRKPAQAQIDEAEERLRTKRDPFSFNGMFAPAVLVLAKTRDREHQAEVVSARIGEFGLAAMPGEIFVELAREVEAGSPFQPTRVIGLTNGCLGYIPTYRGHHEGGYEAGWRSHRYVPETGHAWAARCAAQLRAMADPPPVR